MNTETLASPALADAWRSTRGCTIVLFGGLLAMGLLFRPEIEAAVGVWITSTAYNHCFLVIPIAAYLAWDRRDVLRGLQPRPFPWIAILALPLTVVWLLAERLGIMEGRQLVLLTLVQVLVAAVYGWRCWWAMSGPLLYLYFLVPFGEFLVPRLQDVTTAFVSQGLNLLHVPAFIDGYTIEIPEGTFFIAEACAGLRFLIASIAFGCLYALMIYRTPTRRAAFILAAILIPILANGFRALGIVYLGHVLGSAQAAAADHVVYGWVFFSVVIVLLILVGMPFRQDDRPHQASPRNQARGPATWSSRVPARGALASTLVLLALMAAGPGAAAAIDRRTSQPSAEPQPLDLAPACRTVAVEPAVPPVPGSSAITQRVLCGDRGFVFQLVRFSDRSTAAPVLAAVRSFTPAGPGDETRTTTFPSEGSEAVQWRMIQSSEPAFAVASAIWIDGRPARMGLQTRIHMAWESLADGGLAPVAIVVSPSVDWQGLDEAGQRAAADRLELFLRSDVRIDREVQAQAQVRAGAKQP